ncbi:MAG TPA: glycoside hydrolase family 2 protein [Pyrinomonadaceae bacterium]|nr:glycoside hydrolase family 2 protein [Pyrinomonadaceae bacterium]
MRQRISPALWLLAAACALCWAHSEAAARGPKAVLTLHDGWRFREAGKGEWRPASVPGCVHTDLLANRLIEDPFYRDNEKKLQWVGKTDWEYETTFRVAPSLVARRHVEIVFEGLDTYAAVTLNGTPILSADNMFRTWRVDAKGALRAGENTLRVVFRSPINEVLPRMKALGYELPAPNDQGEKTSPHTRKAPYHYGWDWGPRFVTSGVWRPVRLEAWDAARFDSLRVAQRRLEDARAELSAEAEVTADGPAEATLVVEDVSSQRATTLARRRVRLAAGAQKLTVDFPVERPRRWWPNGLGPQNLYRLRARLVVGGSPADETAARVGLRTLELRQRPDRWGKSFEFVVNGVPVFAKGGNWIPADSFPTRVTRERYRRLLVSARDANMNMLRVWGGGIYESDEFYDLCDELGLLVWQDFMFACSMYPGDAEFLESVRREAADQVRRLRNHPSLALWCGNNEVETAWQHWGWKEKLPARLWDDYKKIFHGVLPEVVAEHDPARAYWPSSPSSNLEEDPDSQRVGDVHYWEVWHASKPFAEYERQFPRFMSEYGFQSFPDIETVNAYTVPSDHDIQSPVMLAHQRHPRGNQLIREYMLREYPEPKDFESFLYVSQVLQAEGIRVGAEHFRRSMPRNMGSLYWQVNDCWPVASWSGVDYFGRWKALHHYAARFYKDLLLSPREEEGEVRFYVVSDRTTPTPSVLKVALMDFEGRRLYEGQFPVEVRPLASGVYASVRREALLRGADTREVFVYCELSAGAKTLASNRLFFEPFKNLRLPRAKVSAEVGGAGRALTVTVRSDRLARAVRLSAGALEGDFTDNFFDLLPGRAVTVGFRPRAAVRAAELRRHLRVRSLADAFPAAVNQRGRRRAVLGGR